MTDAQGRTTAQGSRTVTRDGDEVRVQGQASGRRGTRDVDTKVELDDGRVDKVEREVNRTTRSGQEIEREFEAERKNGGVEFESEMRNRTTGREVEVEGVAGRGAYGRRGVVAEVDRNYGPDRVVAAGRGPIRGGAAVWGPYGGRAVTRLPSGARSVTYWNRPYYRTGGFYYRPYYWGGVPYYTMVPPPWGVFYTSLPVGYVALTIAASSYYYHDHVYYERSYSQGNVSYKVVPAPAGHQITTLPASAATVTLNGTRFYYYQNTFYRAVEQNGSTAYVTVTRPQGLAVVDALPAEFEVVNLNGAAYFVFEQTHYLPYLNSIGEEKYIVVDAPAAAPSTQTASTGADLDSNVNFTTRALTVASGNILSVRISDELSSGTNTPGDRFTGYLDEPLKVGEVFAAAKGTKVYGLITAAKKAGRMSNDASLVLQLTDVELHGQAVPLFTDSFAVDRNSSKTLKTIGGAAALGAIIGAIADGGDGAAVGAAVGAGAGTAAAAASEGDQVFVHSQTVVPFRLARSLNVDVKVRVETVARNE